MLTCFRKLRNGLLDSGQSRKYLLYATGEIALVVIGILIALQINNWNNQAQQDRKEMQWLESLRDDLKNDEIVLNEQLDYGKNSAEVIRSIVSMIDDPIETIQDTAGFLRLLKRVTMTYYFKPTNTTYLEITSSGEFSSISRRELMRRMIEYHQSAQLTDELNEVIKQVKWFRYNEILEQVIDPMIMPNMTEDVFVQINQWPEDEIIVTLLDNKKISLEKIRLSKDFRSVLARSLDMTIVQRGDMYRMLINCRDILNKFEVELGKTE